MKYFIADIHAGHSKVLIGPRGLAFPTIDEWHDHIFGEMNRIVTRKDTLFVLGDLCLKDIVFWRNKINCRDAWLIIGNHDPSFAACELAFGKGKARLTYETKIMGQPCFLSHYPHAFWPKSHRQSHHLYGHTHDQREETLDLWMPDRRSMDVSPETIYRLTGKWGPISEKEIFDILSVRPGHDHVEFYENFRGRFSESCDHQQNTDSTGSTSLSSVDGS